MPTNQEWLHKLANESPDELKAWFDAEHFECPSDAGEAAIMSVDAFIAEHNDNLAAEKVVNDDAVDVTTEKRTKTEHDGVAAEHEADNTSNKSSENVTDSREQLETLELQQQVDRLTRERDNLADDLLTCNREREQLRKHLGIALDHAHDICSLVDIDGNVLDVGD